MTTSLLSRQRLFLVRGAKLIRGLPQAVASFLLQCWHGNARDFGWKTKPRQAGCSPRSRNRSRRRLLALRATASSWFNASNLILVPTELIPTAAIPARDPLGATLLGARPPTRVIEVEQAWHRVAAHLIASGYTQAEVARTLDKAGPTLSNLMRQPWFQAHVTELMHRNGRDIMEAFRAEAFNSMVTLVEVRDNTDAKNADRIRSAVEILDRGYGKSLQRVEDVTGARSENVVDETSRLAREIAEEQKALANN